MDALEPASLAKALLLQGGQGFLRPSKLQAGDRVMTVSSSWGGAGAIPIGILENAVVEGGVDARLPKYLQ
jgi:hypothetical protein